MTRTLAEVSDVFSAAVVAVGCILLAAGAALLLIGLAVGVVSPVARGGGPTSCPSCGYDMRGLTTRRCPECGRKTPTSWWDFTDSMAQLGLNRADRLLTVGAVAFGAGLLVLALI